MILKGRGQLRHHFWGDYRATIILGFHTPEIAAQVAPHFPSFHAHGHDGRALVFFGGGPELETAIRELTAHGAQRKTIESVARSLDWGEPFEVAVDLSPAATAVQLTLIRGGRDDRAADEDDGEQAAIDAAAVAEIRAIATAVVIDRD